VTVYKFEDLIHRKLEIPNPQELGLGWSQNEKYVKEMVEVKDNLNLGVAAVHYHHTQCWKPSPLFPAEN